MRNAALGRALVAALALAAPPAAAVAQTQTVDQVLAAVAAVVRDRAKQVATRVIERKLEDQLCSGSVKLPRRPPAGGGEVAPLELFLGGRAGCQAGYLLSTDARAAARDPDATTAILCRPDDVFVRTCRAIRRLELPLTDPYLLKALSRDTLEFLVRVTARDLDERPFEESGLVEVGAFMHAALEQVGRSRPRPGELAPALLGLADRLSAGVPARTFRTLASTGATAALEASLRAGVVEAWVADGCAPAAGCRLDFFAGCSAYSGLHEPAEAGRTLVFEALFTSTTTPPPLAAGMNAPCDEAFPALKDPAAEARQGRLRDQCRRARLTHNLYGYLVRSRCRQGDAALRSAFRELGYVVGEQRVYRDALERLGLDPRPLDAFLDAVERIDLSDLPREELAAAVRFLGASAGAADLSPARTDAFFAALAADFAAAADRPGLASYAAVLHGAALRTGSPIDGPGLRELRSATKDLLTIPAFAVVRHQRGVDRLDGRAAAVRLAGEQAVRAVNRLLQTTFTSAAGRASARESLGALATFLGDLGAVTAAMADVVEASGDEGRLALDYVTYASSLSAPDRARLFRSAAVALKRGGGALQLAADRDWMGLAIQVSDEIGRRGALGNVEEVERSMRFVRVLLAMYQADSVADAKHIFQTALDEEGSRERRFDAWTWDVAALFGFRGGAQYARDGGFGTRGVSNATLAGLAVPLGVQLASGRWGLLAYPVDLGSYLTATGDPSGSASAQEDNATVRWPDALRFGVATYWRPSRAVPVVAGVGGDYRPQLDRPAQWRVFGTLALELPLFAVR